MEQDEDDYKEINNPVEMLVIFQWRSIGSLVFMSVFFGGGVLFVPLIILGLFTPESTSYSNPSFSVMVVFALFYCFAAAVIASILSMIGAPLYRRFYGKHGGQTLRGHLTAYRIISGKKT